MTERSIQSPGFDLRPLCEADRAEFSEVLYQAFNQWYAQHGWQGDYFQGGPEVCGIFYDIYNDISPGCSVWKSVV